MSYSFFHNTDILVCILVFILLMFVVLEIGYRAGVRDRNKWQSSEAGGGNTVQGAVFALLGLILAFTMASGVSKNDARKEVVLLEANALSTAFLRADLMGEPGRTELKQAVLDYAKTRTFEQGMAYSNEQREEFLSQSLQVQAKLWPITVQVMQQPQASHIEALLLTAINDVLDLHTTRLAASFDRLPGSVLWMLVFIAMVSVGIGAFNAGISERLGRGRMTALILVLASVLLVLLDLDRPNDGMIMVNHQSIQSVIANMELNL